MKMIDVLNMMAEGKIKNDTKLIASTVLDTYEYRYSTGYRRFFNKYFNEIEDDFSLDEDFLNLEVKLIPPKPKKYLIKVNIKGLIKELTVLNYQRLTGKIHLGSPGDTNFVKTSFTKSEMQSIEPIRAFLDDMKGKYTFIEVEENEGDNRHGN